MKSLRSRTRLVFLVASLAVTKVGFSQGIPLENWTVPPYRSASTSGGLTTMVDITPGTAFVGVSPCRLVDTRATSGFPEGYGSP
jgi:hypothetical protein